LPVTLTVHALTHRGAVRSGNEDTVAVGDWICANELSRPKAFTLALTQPLVAVVADGMGGHAAGEVASHTATAHVVAHGREVTTVADAERLLHEANRAVYDAMARGDGAPGMGTTLVGLVARPEVVVVFNLGDSRAYRHDAQAGLVQLSTDDTPGPKLADGRTAAVTTPMVTQSLGGQMAFEPVTPHAVAEALVPGRAYLLCSDGLSDLVGAERIAERLGAADDAAAVEGLFHDAMDAGGKDNISLLLVRVGAA